MANYKIVEVSYLVFVEWRMASSNPEHRWCVGYVVHCWEHVGEDILWIKIRPKLKCIWWLFIHFIRLINARNMERIKISNHKS